AVVGLTIISTGRPNSAAYPYRGNIRYTLQRATGIIAFLFIVWHVIQMHWIGATFGLGGGKFDPETATSSAATVLAPFSIRVLYSMGVLAATFHLANGLWTFGITWGIWTSPTGMRRAG